MLSTQVIVETFGSDVMSLRPKLVLGKLRSDAGR